MNLSVKWKLTLLFSILLLISILSLGGYATVQMEKEVLSVVQKQLSSNLEQTNSIIEETLPGAWAIEAGKLTKGGKVLNDNFDLVDSISQTIGNSIKMTLFQGDTRIATNVILADGKRAVGTKVSDEVKQKTLIGGVEFLGKATVVDEKYQAIYDPIFNQNKEIIGLIFLGVPAKVYNESIDHFAKGMIQIGLIGLIIILGLVYLVAQQSTKLLKRITRIANNIASGNLKNEVLPVKSKDEFGQLSSSMNSMVLSLQQMIHKVNESVGTLTLSSTQLTANVQQTTDTADQVTRTMQDMSIGADQQVKTTVESAKAAEEMTAGIQRIAESTAFVHEASYEMVRKAEAGNTTIQEAVSQINITGSSLQSMSDEVRGLNELLQQIGQMATVIRTISAQTNILSLNAAIEAARAGEQGKGFAVVAAEVRKLAEGTGSSAEQISELIERIQFASEKVVVTADRGLLEVNKGIHLIHNTGEVLQVIVDTSRSVNNQIEEVSAASEQMSAGTEEIASSIQEISNIAIQAASAIQTVAASTEEQLASMEQISVSSEVLHQLAEDLKAVIARYNQ